MIGLVFVLTESYGESKKILNKNSINSLLKYLPNEWNEYDAIIGEPTIFLDQNY